MNVLRSLGSLAKDSVVYGISGVVLRFMSAFLVPIYARAFSPAEYGLMSIVLSTVGLISVFVVLALDNSAARWFYDVENTEDRKITVSTWAWTYLAAASAAGAVLFILAGPLAEALLDSAENRELFQLAAATVPGVVLGQVLFTWLRLQRRPWAAVGYTIWTSSITIVATLILVVGLDHGVAGVFVAQIAAAAGGSLVAIVMLRGWLQPRWFRRDRLTEMLKYALPLIPAALAFWIISMSDRYFLKFLASSSEVGLYQVAYSVAAITYLVVAAFQMAWGPFAFSIHKELGAREVYAKALLGYTWIACLVASGTSILALEVLRVLTTPLYSGAAVAVPWLAFSHVAFGASYIASVGPGIVKTTKPVAAAASIAAVANLALNALLVPGFGIVGAGISTFLSFGLMAGYVFMRSQSLYPIPFRFVPTVALIATSLAFSVALGRWDPASAWIGVPVKLGLLTLFIPAAFAFRFLTMADARRVLRGFSPAGRAG